MVNRRTNKKKAPHAEKAVKQTKNESDISDTDSNSRKRPFSGAANESENNNKKPKTSVSNNIDELEKGALLTLGQGDVGQLGLGDEVLTRKKPALVSELADKAMKLIAAGGMHTVCLTDKNEMYSFGCNDEFALGRKSADDEDSEYEPALVDGLLFKHKVVNITAGDSHTASLTSDGIVYAWGCFRDSHGKLGLIKTGEVCKCPTRLDALKETVVCIASGNDHMVLITVTGKVYTFGCAEQGQLGRIARYFSDRGGRRNSDTLLQPRKVSLPRLRKGRAFAARAYCGAYSSWVVTHEGAVYGFGLNNYNQLGFDDNENRFVPELVTSLSAAKWRQIAAGQHHTLLLDEEGKVHALGRGEYGRLGLGEDVVQVTSPTLIPSLSDIVSVSANASVSFAVDKSGNGYGWGIGTNLQLSTGSEDDEWTPVKLTGRNLESRKVLQIECGGQHTVILASEKDENEVAGTVS